MNYLRNFVEDFCYKRFSWETRVGGAKTNPIHEGFSHERFKAVARMEQRHFWFVARRALISFMIKRLGSTPVNRLVDLGCGPGHALPDWLEHSNEVIGVDMHANPSTEDKAAITTLRRNAADTGIETGSADIVLALDLLEHTDDQAVLKECRRILKPSGSLIVSVPAHQWLWGPRDEAAGHLRRYSKKQLHARLSAAGFEIVQTASYQFFLLPLVMVSRWLSPRSPSVRDIEDSPPAPINRLLSWINRAEVALTQRGLRFPTGSSLLVAARGR